MSEYHPTSAAAPGPTPFWARPSFVLAAILAYLAVHFAIRLVQWPTLAADDSEQALFAQQLAWEYRYKAPPLFTWLLVGIGQVIPIGVVSTSLLRYAFLGTAFVFAYLTARRLLLDPRLAALSAFSFAAIDIFARGSHRELTHATALAAFVSLAWYAFVRLSDTPRLGWYLALGATFGLGMLAKWNFVILAVTLPLACLARRQYRPVVLTWKIVPAAALAAALILPTLIATLMAGPAPGDDLQSALGTASEGGLQQIVKGTLRLANSVIAYPVPLLPMLIAILGLPLWRGLRTGAEASPPRPGPDIAFVGSTIAIGLALTWALVPVLGATVFRVRYLHPMLFIFPTWAFMLAERGRPSDRALQVFALLLLVLALAVPFERLLADRIYKGPENCWPCKIRTPFGPLAAELRAAGYDGEGTILADTMSSGGNLRVQFPRARVMTPPFPPDSWPAAGGEGPCLIVWPIGEAEPVASVPEQQASYLTDVLRAEPDRPHRDGVVSAPHFGDETHLYRMAYRLYPAPNGDCR